MCDRLNRLLTWGLGLALVLSVTGVVYIAVAPVETTESYTEFYILGPDREASGYPSNLTIDESGTVLVGIENYEHHPMTYTVAVREANTSRSLFVRTITLADGERWRDEVSFSFSSSGEKNIILELYRGSEPDVATDPYRNLRLLITVTEQSERYLWTGPRPTSR